MQKNVTPLFEPTQPKRHYRRPDLQNILLELDVAELGKGPSLMERLESADLDGDARGIWMGYPNINHSTQTLVYWIGMEWPTLKNVQSSAVSEAVVSAIGYVKATLAEGSEDRKLITASYYEGLNVIAANLCGVTANGFVDNKLVGIWQAMHQPFHEWVVSNKIDRLVFTQRDASETERIGLSWIIRAKIASAMDIGLMDRHAKI